MIETTCTSEQLQEMMSRLSRGWEHMGATEPYMSVLTNDQYLKANFEANAEGFWKSGETDGMKLLHALDRNSIWLDEFKTCLDYGCGVGRVTRFLARFWQVIGCDQSATHLLAARQQLPDNDRVRWLQWIFSTTTWGHLPDFDILFSVLCFQHDPPPITCFILGELLADLAPAGVAFFHLPTIMPGYSFNTAEYLANPQSGLIMEMHCVPQREIFRIAHQNGCVPIEVRDTVDATRSHTSTLFLFRKSK